MVTTALLQSPLLPIQPLGLSQGDEEALLGDAQLLRHPDGIVQAGDLLRAVPVGSHGESAAGGKRLHQKLGLGVLPAVGYLYGYVVLDGGSERGKPGARRGVH